MDEPTNFGLSPSKEEKSKTKTINGFLCKSDLKRLRDALNMYKLMFSISLFTFALVCTLFVALLSGRSKLKVE